MSLDDLIKHDTVYEIRLINNGDIVYTNKLTNKQLSNSVLLKTLMTDTEQEEKNVIQVTGNYSKKIMDAVVEYLIHHNGNDIKVPVIPLRVFHMNYLWPLWDVLFIENYYNNNIDNLCELAICANYFDINGLISLSLTKIASLIKSKSLDFHKPSLP